MRRDARVWYPLFSNGGVDLVLLKLSAADGATLSAQGFGGPGYEGCRAVVHDPTGGVYLLNWGSNDGTLDFGGGGRSGDGIRKNPPD